MDFLIDIDCSQQSSKNTDTIARDFDKGVYTAIQYGCLQYLNV